MHFLNVERNDAILIRCEGECAFIDSGSYIWGAPCADYLQSVGVTSLKYYIGTHAHLDHVGGAPAVLAAFPTEAVLEPHAYTEAMIRYSAVTDAEKQAVSEVPFQILLVGQSVTVGSATLDCLGPINVRSCNYMEVNENYNSLVLMLSYGETRFLLTGDTTNFTLNAIETANPGSLRADVYKNMHHTEPTNEHLLNAIRPDYVIFSTSSSDMPMRVYVQQLSEMGSRMLITSDNHSGNIVMTSDGREIAVQTQYAPTSMELGSSELSLCEGTAAFLNVTFQPNLRFQALTWSSDNPNVAKVDGKGKVTGVQAGQTIIRATDGSGMSAFCLVTVHTSASVRR